MADVFKPTYARPIPGDAKVHSERGPDGKRRRYIIVKANNGRDTRAYLTEDRTRYLHQQKKWAGYYHDYNAKRRKITLCTDKAASQSALAELTKTIELLWAGRPVAPIDEIPPVIRRAVQKALEESGQAKKTQRLGRQPLSVHLDSYLTHLKSKGTTQEHRKEVRRCVETVAGACGFSTLAEVELTPIEHFVNYKKAEGVSDRTTNVYCDRFRYFVRWALQKGIIDENPLEGMRRRNEK